MYHLLYYTRTRAFPPHGVFTLSCVWLTYETSSLLHDWTYCTFYIYTVRDCWQHSAIALRFNVEHALGFEVFTSRILVTDFTTSNHTCHSLIPFLPFLLNRLWLPSPELDPSLSTTVMYSSTLILLLLSESESYITTDSQSASLSWNKAPIWGLRPDIYLSLTITALFFVGVLSDKRTGLTFVYAAGTRQRSLSWVGVPLDSYPYFTVSDLRLPFSSPPTTRRVTVEVFDPASTQGWRYSIRLNSI
jgi:hypothetical protein